VTKALHYILSGWKIKQTILKQIILLLKLINGFSTEYLFAVHYIVHYFVKEKTYHYL